MRVTGVVQNEKVSSNTAGTAELHWVVDLQEREFREWRNVTWSIQSIVGGFVGHAPDVADLIIRRHDTGEIVYPRPAGDMTAAGQILLTTKRELSGMTRDQFAAEWSFNQTEPRPE